MHVGDGQLSAPVLAVGAIGAASGLIASLARLDDRRIPRIAILSSLFFAVSLWHVPLPLPNASIHLVLYGLLGLLLGWDTFIAVSLVLLLQAMMFGHGGITSLGVNVLAMALPGPIWATILAPTWKKGGPTVVFLGGFALGSLSILTACTIVVAAYGLTSVELAKYLPTDFVWLLHWLGLDRQQEDFTPYLPVYFVANVPLMVIEGFLTGSTVTFLSRVRPDIIGRANDVPKGSAIHVS